MSGIDGTTSHSPSPPHITEVSDQQQSSNESNIRQWQHRSTDDAPVSFEEFRRNLESGLTRQQIGGRHAGEYIFDSPRRMSIDDSLQIQPESVSGNQSRQSSFGLSTTLASLRLRSRTASRDNTVDSRRSTSLSTTQSLLASSPTEEWKNTRGFLEARDVDMASLAWVEYVRPKPGDLVQQFMNDLKDGLLPVKGHNHIPGMRGVLYVPLADPNADKITYQFSKSGNKWALTEIEFDRKINGERQTLRFSARDVSVEPPSEAKVPALPQEIVTIIAGETTLQARANMRLTSKPWKLAAETAMTGLIAHNKNGLDLIKQFPAYSTLQRLKVTGDDVSADDLRDLSTQLEELDLSGCPNISDLSIVPPSVRKLSLAGNETITNTDLASLGALPNLEEIDLSGCHNITGSGFASLPGTVRKVSLASHNSVSGIDLARMPTWVRDLNLSSTAVFDQDIGTLPPNLERLDLSNCQNLTDVSGTALPRQLQHVSFKECPNITEGIFTLLPVTLQSMDVRGCDVDGQSFPHLPQTLREIAMTGATLGANLTPITYVMSEDLTHLPQGLESLCIETGDGYGPNIDDAGIQNLPRNLQTLKLDTCPISNQGLAYLPPGLTTLSLRNCSQIDATGIDKLPASVQTSLRELDLSHCYHINDQAVERFPRDLEKVNLEFCAQITDAGLAHLPASVKSLDLRSCSFSNAALANLPRSVRDLNISLSAQITDEGLTGIPATVETLDISYNIHITGTGLDNLPTSIRRVNAYQCLGITDDDISRLRQRGVEVVRQQP